MYCSESQDPFPQSCEDHLGHTTVTCISSFLWQFANTIQKTAVVQRKICKLKAEQVIVTGHIVILYDHQAPSAKFKTKPASCFSTWTDTSWTMPSATLRKSKWDRRSKPELFLQNKHLSKLLLNIWISFEYLWLESGDVSYSTLPRSSCETEASWSPPNTSDGPQASQFGPGFENGCLGSWSWT